MSGIRGSRGARGNAAGWALFACACAGAMAVAAGSSRKADAAGGRYAVVDTIHLGGEGGWDYLTADGAGRLYFGRSTRVQVLDLKTGKLAGEMVTVFDLETLAPTGRIRIGAWNPDAILYEPVTHRVFTMNGGSGNATVIEGATGKIVGNVALGGRPEFAVADGRGRVFVNLEDSSAVVAFDAKTLALGPRWPLAPGEGPTGLAIDTVNHVLFSVCGNGKMIVLDAGSGRVLAALPIGNRTDGAAFDPMTKLAFSSNGEGTLTVVREDSPTKFTVVDTVATASARCLRQRPSARAHGRPCCPRPS
ncbi:MAG: YncE family protein [Candidatus Eisenbacteria bacterium]|uniref:YncE family protein n=1 Tax=Eiseniibacteriota bacterium TaxID=2212470 RepID=A0A538SYS8_UNCEI|nr:MAG: YncE family protein [Candidatus Eisenbacteria bacterium]